MCILRDPDAFGESPSTLTDASAWMTKVERDELRKLLKVRARVALRAVEQRAAELRADVEAQLAAAYKAHDPAWKDLTAPAEAGEPGGRENDATQ
jgi:hypothetical protein